MTDQSKDRVEGKSDEVMGRAKSAFGDLTGDEQTKAEGETQETSGEAKQGLADAKDKVDNLVKKATQ
ncbi:MAG TPA: CsbD family protein [Thermomicrobiales bacterium]|nr:CsbD family protein [Thermomicrobiales bacterium]